MKKHGRAHDTLMMEMSESKTVMGRPTKQFNHCEPIELSQSHLIHLSLDDVKHNVLPQRKINK